MAYSSRADRFVLFGGWDGVRGLNGTWVFDPANRAWTELHPASSPIARGDEMFVYDNRSDLFILFGGWYEFPNGTYERLSDTWVLSLTEGTWTQRHPAASPSPRSDAEVAYDPRADAVLLVGGFSGTSYLGDVWAYFPTNDTWSPRAAPTTPSSRADGRMVYVSSQDRFILFGGNDYSGPNFTFHHLADTWSYRWISNEWSLIPVASAPEARDYPVFAVDLSANMVLLTAGFGNRTVLNDIWGFDLAADTWSNLTPAYSPPGRYAGAGGFDPLSNILVLFSGAGSTGLLADTWYYQFGSSAPAAGFPLWPVALVAIASSVCIGILVILLRNSRRPRAP